MIGIDLIIGLAAALLAAEVWSQAPIRRSALIWLIVWLFSTGSLGGYSARRETAADAGVSLRAAVTSLACCIVLPVLLPGMELHLVELLIFITVVTCGAATGRLVFSRVCRPRTIIVTTEGQQISSAWARDNNVFQFVLTPHLLGNPDELSQALVTEIHRIDATYVQVASDVGLTAEGIRKITWMLRQRRTILRVCVDSGPIRPARVYSTVSHDHAVLEITAPAQTLPVRMAKRGMDVIGSAVLMIILAPVLIAVALAISFTSQGPVLYRQQRIGKDGIPFNILKFRSMELDADSKLQHLLRSQAKGDEPLFKVDNDPRVTSIGRFLRRYSLDELPQLINVFAGSMSLVGPRPQRPAEVELYEGNAEHRLGVSPGMTGLWQVSGRSRLTWQEAQELDITYAHNWSLGMDLQILARTARAVLGADGAS
ncbi:exopolysaccharide biosynthesis polyprenyl glycosylphosphotransferase [Arthrobacter pigmenti]